MTPWHVSTSLNQGGYIPPWFEHLPIFPGACYYHRLYYIVSAVLSFIIKAIA